MLFVRSFMSDGVCCICGYPKAYKSGSYRSACAVCAEKIYFATTKADSPEHLERQRAIFAKYNGDGFDHNSSWDPKVKIAQEQFKKFQDRTQYKAGDRLQVRIKNGEAIWATVIEYRDASKDVLLFLDKDFETGIYHSWATMDSQRRTSLKELELDSSQPNCFWWGNFSDNYYAGSKDITVINYEPSEGKVKAPTKMHYDYTPGDRIKIKIKGGSPIWATFVEKGADNKNSLIYLDIPGMDSWITGREGRIANLQKLGLDTTQPKCLFWGDRDNTISTRYLNNDIEVIEHKPTTKLSSKYWFDCETEIQAGVEVNPTCKHRKKHDASQMKVYAALKKDKSVEIVNICPNQYNRQDEYGWKKVFDKLTPLATGRPTSYKNGDRLQVDINGHITWATVIDDIGYFGDKKQPMLHLDHPHKGAHTDIHHPEKVKKMGFDTTKPNFWWLEKADRVLYHQINEGPPEAPDTFSFHVGDTVKYTEADVGNAKKDHTYKITKIDRDAEEPKFDGIYLEGGHDADWLYAYRFKKLPYAIGTRVEIEFGKKHSWATIVGYEAGNDGKEKPIVYLDTPGSGFGRDIDVFHKNSSDLTKNLTKLGLDPKSQKFWVVHPSDKMTVHNIVLECSDDTGASKAEPGPLLIDIPITDNKDIVIKNVDTKNVSANDLWITFNYANDYKDVAASNTVSSDTWDKIKEELVDSFIVDPEKINYDGKTWFAQFGNEPPKNAIPKEPEKSFGSMVKEDAASAGYRVVAGQLTKGVKSALLKFMGDRGADNNKIALVQEFLDTEIGGAFIGMLLGYSLTYAPKISEDPRAKKLAGEFRVGSMTIAGNTLMDIVWQYVRNLPSPEKVRVNEKEVRIAEDINEEVEENEKSSSSSNN